MYGLARPFTGTSYASTCHNDYTLFKLQGSFSNIFNGNFSFFHCIMLILLLILIHLRMPYVNNNDYLELAKLDFNNCQALHQLEWDSIQQ